MNRNYYFDPSNTRGLGQLVRRGALLFDTSNFLSDDQHVAERQNDSDREYGQAWSAWLREKLAGRKQRWIVERSNGAITASRVSTWINKGQRPDADGIARVADIFDEDRGVLLRRFGYGHLVPLAHKDRPPPQPAEPADELLQEIHEMDIPAPVKKILLERRERTIREFQERRQAELEEIRRIAAALNDSEQEREPN